MQFPNAHEIESINKKRNQKITKQYKSFRSKKRKKDGVFMDQNNFRVQPVLFLMGMSAGSSTTAKTSRKATFISSIVHHFRALAFVPKGMAS